MNQKDLEGLKKGDVVQHNVTLKLSRVSSVEGGYVSLEPVLHPDDLDEYDVVVQKKEPAPPPVDEGTSPRGRR